MRALEPCCAICWLSQEPTYRSVVVLYRTAPPEEGAAPSSTASVLESLLGVALLAASKDWLAMDAAVEAATVAAAVKSSRATSPVDSVDQQQQQQQDRPISPRTGAILDAAGLMPCSWAEVAATTMPEGDADCPVCHELFTELTNEDGSQREVVQMPCRHTVCCECLADWIKKRPQRLEPLKCVVCTVPVL